MDGIACTTGHVVSCVEHSPATTTQVIADAHS
jgi:hypothetical protein